MPSFSNLNDRRCGKSRTVSAIQTIQWMRPHDALSVSVQALPFRDGRAIERSSSARQLAHLNSNRLMRVNSYQSRVVRQTRALAIGVMLYSFVSGLAQAGQIITFDAPGAGTGAGQGTYAVNINDFGVTIGYFIDTNTVYHGFVRTLNGAVTTIDAPGAGAVPGSGQGSVAYSINLEGVIAGEYQDANYVYHSFLRTPNGRFVTFDAPGAGTGANQGTLAVDINLEGEIAGYTQDNNNVFHGFLRSPTGVFRSFDAPNAGTGQFQGTVVTLESGLNASGAVIGWYFDSSGAAHGYLRRPNGAIISFDPPGSVFTIPGAINPEGVIVGGALDANGTVHGFIRSTKGVITSFEVPGEEGTLADGLTPFGVSAGYCFDSNGWHGFIRYADGTFTKFDAPGAGTTPLHGTVGEGMNDWVGVVGYLIDANNVGHGFIRIP